MADLNIFVPLSKIDEEQRLVYGTVAAEVLDNSGEMFDYDSSKPYFQKWSDNAHATSGGKSRGNLRVMHGSKVAGIISDLAFDDDNGVIECCAKVVDDGEWAMCKAGGYTGFSMGGRYVARLTKDGVKRYTADPCEISLVDKPCIPTATFDVVKADGIVVEQRHFAEAVQDPELAKVQRHSHRDVRGAFASKKVGEIVDHGSGDPTGHGSSEAKADAVNLTNTQAADLFAKSDGENQMYVPTNDEMLPVAQELAKAAGSEGSWLDLMDAAREQLVEKVAKAPKPTGDPSKGPEGTTAKTDDAGSKPGHKGGDKPNPVSERESKAGSIEQHNAADATGDADSTAKAHEDAQKAGKDHVGKADTPGVTQKWEASDGKTFAKKADAIAHTEALAKAAGGPKSLAEQLSELTKSVQAVSAGDVAPAEEPGEEPGALLTKYADFLDAARVLDLDEPLKKGMYEVSSFADALRNMASLQIRCASEAKREGDGSGVPASILEAVKMLGTAFVAMAQEEVAELTASLASPNEAGEYGYCDPYMALAHQTLGLEKADLVGAAEPILAKRAELGDLRKVDVPAAPDQLAKLASVEEENRLLKSDVATLRADVAAAGPMIASLGEEIEKIKKMAMPKAPTTHVVVEKGGDTTGPLAKNDLLAKFAPEDLADAAFRMAHRNPHHLISNRVGGQ